MATMRFYGRFQGQPITAEWTDGLLYGPPIFRTAVMSYAIQTPDIPITAEGPMIEPGIEEHLPAYYTISRVFDSLPDVRGDIPEWAD